MGLANSKPAITSFENPEHSSLVCNSLFFVGGVLGLYERVMHGGKKNLARGEILASLQSNDQNLREALRRQPAPVIRCTCHDNCSTRSTLCSGLSFSLLLS